MHQKQVIILTGPTASGKSSLALDFGIKNSNIDIINADSMQVYSEIPIICANPSKSDINLVNHKLYGFLKANEPLNAGIWIEMIKKEIEDTINSDKIPFLVGGSTMYIRLLVDGIRKLPEISQKTKDFTEIEFKKNGKDVFYENLCKIDPICLEKINKNDTQRAIRAFEVKIETGKSFYDKWEMQTPVLENFDVKKIALMPDVETVYRSCNSRFDDMIKNGVVDEVRDFLKIGYDKNLSARKAIGVPEIELYLNNEISLQEAIEKTKQHTRNYAKRQRTWINNNFKDFSILAKKNLEEFEKVIHRS